MRHFIVALLALSVAAPAFAEPYTGNYKGWHYDWQSYRYYKIEYVPVPQPIFVPQLYPATLLVNVQAPAAPPAVTFAAPAQQAQVQTQYQMPVQQVQPQIQAQQAAPVCPPPMDAALDARLKRLEAMMEKMMTPQPAPQAMPKPPEPAQPATQSRAPRLDLLPSAVAVLRANRCAECHTGAASREGVQLFNDNGAFEVKGTSYGAIWDAVSRDKMPYKIPEKVSPDHKAVIRAAFVG